MSEEMALYEKMLEEMGIDVSEGSLANVPAPVVSFAAGSFIAKWNAFMGFHFMSEEDHVLLRGSGQDVPEPDVRAKLGTYYQYYYRDYDAANEAYLAIVGENDFSPSSVWVFFVPTTDVLIPEERRENFLEAFGEIIVRHVPVKRLNKGSAQYPARNRHPYNLISLPCAVASMADFLGIENPGFDVTELMLAEADTKEEAEKNDELVFFDDETFANLCGDIEGSYTDAALWKRRVALWKALGEEDGRKHAMKGSKTASGRAHSLATASDKLNFSLSIAQGHWRNSRWAELTSLNDPRPDAVSSSGNRLTVSAITKLFKSEAEARKYFAETTGEEGVEGSGGLQVPENWRSGPVEEWLKYLSEQEGKPAPVAAQELYCDPAEVAEWRESQAYKEYQAQ